MFSNKLKNLIYWKLFGRPTNLNNPKWSLLVIVRLVQNIFFVAIFQLCISKENEVYYRNCLFYYLFYGKLYTLVREVFFTRLFYTYYINKYFCKKWWLKTTNNACFKINKVRTSQKRWTANTVCGTCILFSVFETQRQKKNNGKLKFSTDLNWRRQKIRVEWNTQATEKPGITRWSRITFR